MLAPPPLMACTIITRTRTSALLARGRFFGELPDELVTHIIHQLHGYALLAAATCHRTRAIVDSMLSGLPFENENDTSAERRARASPMIKLRVTVPPNSMGGDHVRLMTPVGLQMVQIPAGLQPGEQFDVVCHPSNVLKGSDGVPHYMIRRYDPFRTWDLSMGPLYTGSGGPASLHLQRRGPRRLVSQGTNDPLFLRCTCEVGAHPLLMPQGCSFLRARPRLVPGACLLYNLGSRERRSSVFAATPSHHPSAWPKPPSGCRCLPTSGQWRHNRQRRSRGDGCSPPPRPPWSATA